MTQMPHGLIKGFGGVFIKSKNPASLSNWYKRVFGLSSELPGDENGPIMTFPWMDASEYKKCNTVLGMFDQSSDYFEPSHGNYMLCFLVQDIKTIVDHLKESDITVIGEIQRFAYGKMVHIIDPEGNVIELWEPYKNRTES